MTKRCISCGMPMSKAEDFPLGDPGRDYCVHCARADGTMKSYEEALAGIAGFIVATQGLDEGAARTTARTLMRAMPAWSGR